jgi:hypothetical protein
MASQPRRPRQHNTLYMHRDCLYVIITHVPHMYNHLLVRCHTRHICSPELPLCVHNTSLILRLQFSVNLTYKNCWHYKFQITGIFSIAWVTAEILSTRPFTTFYNMLVHLQWRAVSPFHSPVSAVPICLTSLSGGYLLHPTWTHIMPGISLTWDGVIIPYRRPHILYSLSIMIITQLIHKTEGIRSTVK